MRPRAVLLVSFVLAAATCCAAADREAGWKSRYDTANEAAMQTDLETSRALFASLGNELERELKDAKAKSPASAETATAEVWLASVYLNQGRHAQAAPLLQDAYEIRVKKFGEESEPVAEVLDRLARLGHDEEEAIALLERALAIREKVHGPVHPTIAANLHDIGINRLTVHKYRDAEAAYKRAIAIMEQVSGRESIDVVEPLYDLAWLYLASDREKEAIPVYQRALAIVEKSVAADDDKVADALEHLGYAYRNAERLNDAEPLYVRAVVIREKHHGPKHLLTLSPIGHLKDIYDAQGRTEEADVMGRRLEP
jgi:tetratricopeptide (TPR) repeat protein